MEAWDLPQLVVRVGLTGHRPNRMGVADAWIQDQVTQVLACVERVAEDLSHEDSDLYAPQRPILKRFTCGLAPGADVLGAQVALQLGWDLQAVLAFTRQRFADLQVDDKGAAADRYRVTLKELLRQSHSVLELCGDEQGGLRRDGYELVGEIMLEQSDVVIAVWDGGPARGLGGTAHLARVARERGLPLVWIDASRQAQPQVYLPGVADAAELAVLENWLRNSLSLASSPASAAHASSQAVHHDARDVLIRWRDFVRDTADCTTWFPPVFQWLLVLGGKRRPNWCLTADDSQQGWAQNWREYGQAVSQDDPHLADAMTSALQQPFHRADHLAEVYGRRYRGAYVLIYLLAGLATSVGLWALFFPHAKVWLVGAELGMIAAMAVLAWAGSRAHWHERWVEYRALAEQLRQARMGVWSGQARGPSGAEGDSSHAGASWVAWYARACIRQLPLASTTASPAYLRRALSAIEQHEIRPQCEFNQRTAAVQSRVHHRLESFENIILGTLVLAGVCFLLVYAGNPFGLGEDRLKQLGYAMTFAGALLPALGAVLLGVRSQGDFSAYAERSAETAAQLQPALLHAQRLIAENASQPPQFQDLLEITQFTTAALASDVFAWRMVYRRKPLTVSA